MNRPADDIPLSRKVYQQLLDRLADGRLRGGQLITRRAMAAELGVSLAPVAEAFAALDREGLLETLPRKGTRVRAFTLDDARNQTAVRLALECEVARLVCRPRARERLHRLDSLADLLDSRVCRNVERWNAEIALHLGLAELTELPLLTRSLEQVLRQSYFMALQAIAVLSDGRRPASRHRSLLASLARGRPEAAARAMREHLLNGAAGDLLGSLYD